MKYIFGIQSHITFYVAHRIIQLENLNPNDCIMIAGRNYQMPEKYQMTYKNIWQINYGGGKIGRFFSGFNIYRTINNIKNFDKQIEKYTAGDDYNCYITYCGDDIANLLVTNKKCKHYFLIEEGLGVYINRNCHTFQSWKYWIYKLFLKPIFPRLYAIKENYQYPDYYKFKCFYATSPKAYPYFRDYPIKVIGNPFEVIDLGFTPDAVLSIDPLFWDINTDTVEIIYQQLSQYIKRKNYHTIVYKFHPMFGVYPEIRKQYNHIIHKFFGENIIELKDTAVLENILTTYKCDFYSAGSSIQIYGTIAGAKCYSFSSLTRKYTQLYDNTIFQEYAEEIVI